jgi:hypothetical protein
VEDLAAEVAIAREATFRGLRGQCGPQRGDVTGDARYRHLGYRESKEESFDRASSEVPRERDRELSASRRIGSREFELQIFSATIGEER